MSTLDAAQLTQQSMMVEGEQAKLSESEGEDNLTVQEQRRTRKRKRERKRRSQLSHKFEQLRVLLKKEAKAEQYAILSDTVTTITVLRKELADLQAMVLSLQGLHGGEPLAGASVLNPLSSSLLPAEPKAAAAPTPAAPTLEKLSGSNGETKTAGVVTALSGTQDKPQESAADSIAAALTGADIKAAAAAASTSTSSSSVPSNAPVPEPAPGNNSAAAASATAGTNLASLLPQLQRGNLDISGLLPQTDPDRTARPSAPTPTTEGGEGDGIHMRLHRLQHLQQLQQFQELQTQMHMQYLLLNRQLQPTPTAPGSTPGIPLSSLSNLAAAALSGSFPGGQSAPGQAPPKVDATQTGSTVTSTGQTPLSSAGLANVTGLLDGVSDGHGLLNGTSSAPASNPPFGQLDTDEQANVKRARMDTDPMIINN
jgi:hypothetical protein